MKDFNRKLVEDYYRREREDEQLKKTRDKLRVDYTQKRDILLMANKKIRFSDLYKFYSFLMPFTAIRRIEYVDYQCLQKTMMEDYLLKIHLDETGLLIVEDASKTDDWFGEMNILKIRKLSDAFGTWDDKDLEVF